MENEPDKIKSPFRTPDGYFDDFEKNLRLKMNQPVNKPLSVSYRRPIMDWIAVAATLTAIVVSGWFVYQKTISTGQIAPDVAVEMPVPIEAQPSDTSVTPMLEVETALAETVYEEIYSGKETLAPTVTNSSLSSSDAAIALELEDAGLIVMETNDGMFDPFEL